MKTRSRATAIFGVLAFALAAGLGAARNAYGVPLGTAFTYQGQLIDGGGLANGTYDLRFILWDAETGGLPVATMIEVDDVAISGGQLHQQLDFGAVFNANAARWLQISVRPGASKNFGDYVALPRQRITATPVAQYATTAGALPDGAVNGTMILNGTISAEDVGFNYAGSTTKGGPASDVVCAGCIDLSDLGSGKVVKSINGIPDAVTLAAGENVSITPSGSTLTIASVGGGDISSVTAGAGLTGGGTTGAVTVSVGFGGSGTAATVSRSDHAHIGAEWAASVALGPVLAVENTGNSVLNLPVIALRATSNSAEGRGVWASSANGIALDGDSTAGTGVSGYSRDGYGGVFRSGSSGSGVGAKVTGAANQPDLILGGLSNTSAGDDGTISSDPSYPGSDIFLSSNDAVVARLDQDNDEDGQFEIRDGANTVVFSVKEAGDVVARDVSAQDVSAANVTVTGSVQAYDGISANHIGSPTIAAGNFFRVAGDTGQLLMATGTEVRVGAGDLHVTGAADAPGGDLFVDQDVEVGGYVAAVEGFCLLHADFAEMLPATAGAEPGDVLVISEDGSLEPSNQPRDPRVAGIYSSQPGIVGGSDGVNKTHIAGKVPLAVVGVVPVKVTAENGPIASGSLLVTSHTPGHAMKADERPAIGTVIGKALGALNGDEGVITMLVTLQ